MKNKKSSSKKSNESKSKQQVKLSPWLWLLLIIPIAILSAFLIQRQNSIKIVESKPKENVQVSQNETQDPLQLPLEISVKEAHQMYQDGIFMLDVREVDEWNAGHIPGATLIHLGSLERNAQAVPKDEQVVIVCRSGNRSAQARDILKRLGYQYVTSMKGGMNDWIRAGYDVEIGGN